MNINIKMYVIVVIVVSSFMLLPLTARVGATTSTVDLTYKFSDLANPGADHYEGWLIVDGNAVSTGSFTVDNQGNIKDLNGNPLTAQTVKDIDLSKTTKYVLTLEPKDDSNPDPSSIKLLAGNISDNKASLIPNLGVSLSNIAGSYILATPSDGANTNEKSGIWYLDPTSGTPQPSLSLPDLSGTAWVYEGWIVLNGTAVTTGRFNVSSGVDSFDGYSGSQGYPPFPGEDFIKNAPAGLIFPTDFSGAKAVISIEPRMDNSPEPFQFKPLVANIPNNAMDHHLYTMNDTSNTLASGTVTISSTSASTPFEGTFSALFVLLIVSVLITSKRKRNKF